jgi:hypothetical protein
MLERLIRYRIGAEFVTNRNSNATKTVNNIGGLYRLSINIHYGNSCSVKTCPFGHQI